MINIDVPGNRSVIVFSSFRTRSTALCDCIAQQNGLTNFDEAFLNVRRTMSFVNFVNNQSGNFVIKVMCNTNQYTPEIQQFLQPLLNQCTIIRLRRRDVIAQIISFYIAAVNDRWHWVKKPMSTHLPLPGHLLDVETSVDTVELKKAAISILTANQRLQAINVTLDLDLVSEDLGVLPSNYQVMPPAANLDQLNTALKTLIDSDTEVHDLYHNRQDFSHFGK
jgi:hypothetical protein